MSDWPKKMWLDDLGIAGNVENLGDIPIIVYPADQAPEPMSLARKLFDAYDCELEVEDGITAMANVLRKVLAPPSESADLDRLRTENATLRNIVETFPGIEKDLDDYLQRAIKAEKENATLRELVQEAHDDDLPGCHTHGPEWNERAEKALAGS